MNGGTSSSSSSVSSINSGSMTKEGSDSSVWSVSAEKREKERNMDEGRIISFLKDGDYIESMEQCRKELGKKTPNRSHIYHLLKDTYQARRKEIKKIDDSNETMVSSILQDWPCLEYGPYVSAFQIM